MGKLFDQFGGLTYRNEAEVSQNFVLPLLQDFLGYALREIIPEKIFPARALDWGVTKVPGGSKMLNHRPDFVVCINGQLEQVKFIIDTKGPQEDIDGHVGQLRSYATTLGVNLLLMTNGRDLKVFDVNHPLFHSVDIVDLQLKIDQLVQLLGRTNQRAKSAPEIIQGFDFTAAISPADQAAIDRKVQQKRLLLADFQVYLGGVSAQYERWHLPSWHFDALDNLALHQIDPSQLLSFQKRGTVAERPNPEKEISLPDIEADSSLNTKFFEGETGSGKSCLLKYLTYRVAEDAKMHRETRIPVFVALREIGHGYSLETLIVSALNRYGYPCSHFHTLPKANDFVFFLDAYDEIRQEFLEETFLAIERLSATHEIYLTTRPNRPAPFKASATYVILPISEEQSQALVRKHLGNQYYTFKQQLEWNNLTAEAGNILLLLFLISLFKESGSLPPTVMKVIHAVVSRTRNWQESKRQTGHRLSWQTTQDCLAVLAYRVIDVGETALSREEAELLLREKMEELDRDRKIPRDWLIDDLLHGLAETGLLIVNQDHLYFWHRVFLQYFAAVGLKTAFAKDKQLIGKLVPDSKWDIAIVGLASFLPSVTELLTGMEGSLWLRAACVAENNNGDSPEILAVTNELMAALHSPILANRHRAVNFLSSIHRDNLLPLFLSVPEGDYPADVRARVLAVLGKTRSPEALALLYRHLTWDEGNFVVGWSSGACIARALYYYGEPEHEQIIELWSRSQNLLVDEECKHIFIELYNGGLLTRALVRELQQLFLKQLGTKGTGRWKLDALAEVLPLVPDEDFGMQVVDQAFLTREMDNSYGVYKLLRAYRSPGLIEQISEKILANTVADYTTLQLAEIITESACEVPKETYFKLAVHNSLNVASRAIGALKRFPYPLVKEHVERHLYGDQPQLQSWALQVLTDNGEIIPLIRGHRFPSPFYSPAAHTLLKAVRLFRLSEGLSLMERLFAGLLERKDYTHEVHLSLDLAQTFYFLGEVERHAAIVGWFFDGFRFLQEDDHIHVNLMRELRHFDPELSVQVASCYFRTYFPFKDDQTSYKATLFLEAAEELGQHRLVGYVKQIADSIINEIKVGKKESAFDLERPMRTLVKLAQPSDEQWVLDHLEDTRFDAGFEFIQLRRALECLAYIGTARALPYIRQIARQCKDSEMVLNNCQLAYEQICYREKMVFQINELLRELTDGPEGV